MTSFTFLPVPNDVLANVQYGNEEFVEIHLDERFHVGKNMHFRKVWHTENNETIIQKDYIVFSDPDVCIDFVTTYEWRKIFISLTDKLSYMLPIIHDLPQIVYIYIYSTYPENVPYCSVDYPKLRAIVNENSPDADKQLLDDIQTFRRDLMPINVVNPIKRKTKLLIQEPLKMETFSVVWMQDNDDSSTYNSSPITDVIDCLHIFFAIKDSINYIKSSDNTNIMFISSYSNNETIVKQIENLSNITAIYLLGDEEQIPENPYSSITKVRGTYSDIRTLSDQLYKDYQRYNHNSQMPVSIFDRDIPERTIRDLTNENSRFLWLQLLVDILINIPYNDQAKDDMLDVCRMHYGDNSSAKRDMDIFEKTYKSTEALKFYTKPSFLFNLFNRAFRKENIDFLFIFRFFLADMYRQLQKLCQEQVSVHRAHDIKRLRVFRGQIMSISEFNHIKNNVDRLISINTFFSTTCAEDIAILFSGTGEIRDPDKLSIVFEIEIDLTEPTRKRPFASLKDLSMISDEEEVLFSVGSTFRILSVEDKRTHGGYWQVKLKFVDDDSDIKELRSELENSYCKKSNLWSLGDALSDMGDYDRAERYLQMLLECVPESHEAIGFIYNSLGKNSSCKGDYQAALTYHEESLKFYKKVKIYDMENNIRTAYAHIGTAYHGLGNSDLATKYCSMGIDQKSSPEELSYAYNQMAIIHRDRGDNRLALEYFEKTLHIEEQILKKTIYHPLLATMYNNIGEIYIRLGDNEQAVKYLEHALDVRLKGTVSTHTDLAAIYNNLGLVFQNRKELKKALNMFENALEIDTKILHDNHESLALSHNNIATIYLEMNDLSKALHHAETALRILLRSQSRNKIAIVAAFQFNIGQIQLHLGNYTKALKITEKSLKNQLELLPENHKDFVRTYVLLSSIYEGQEDMPKALEYLEKSVDIARISILSHDELEFKHLEMKLEMLRNGRTSNIRKVSNSVLDINTLPTNSAEKDTILSQVSEQLKHVPSDNILERIVLLTSLISVHSSQENFQMAMKCFQEAYLIYTQNKSSDLFFQQKLECAMANLFFGASRVHYRQKNWTMSIEMLQQALDFALKQELEHWLLAEIYNCLGLSYAHQLHIPLARHYFELAISTARKKLPENHPNIERYLGQLRQLYP